MTFVASGSDLSSPSPSLSDSSGPLLDTGGAGGGLPSPGGAAMDDGSNGSWVTEDEQVEDGTGDAAEDGERTGRTRAADLTTEGECFKLGGGDHRWNVFDSYPVSRTSECVSYYACRFT